MSAHASKDEARSTTGTGAADAGTAKSGNGALRGRSVRRAVAGEVLPTKAAEDDPRRWGDQPGSYDHDAWLREQRPPHWG